MSRTFAALAMVALALVAFTASATTVRAPEHQAQSSDSATDAAQMVRQAFDDFSHNDLAAARAGLDNAIEARGFADLSSDLRYRALFVASFLASQNGENKKAHDLAMRATDFAQADDVAWLERLNAAFAVENYEDAGHSLAILAQRWPQRLGSLDAGAITQLHYRLKHAKASEVDRDMLDALFDAEWRSDDVEPSNLWSDLALAHIERNEIERATKVAKRITSGQIAVGLLVDKRFDPITRGHRKDFDVDRLIAAEIDSAQAQVKAHPDQLEPVTELQELFLITRQYPRVLSVSDAAVAHAEHEDGNKTYTDFDGKYNWVLDNRARAMEDQGKWDNAVRIRSLAARRPEQGGMNVSQLINLGDLYADLEQPEKAANAIVELGDMSPFGRMQLESVKLRIAIEKKDEAAIDAAMAYLREHRADALGTWEDALLLRGQLDEAAALLIERLENPDWRNDALVDMQRYAEVTKPPVEQTINDRWNTITARQDVQAAMQKVGRVEQFDITSALR